MGTLCVDKIKGPRAVPRNGSGIKILIVEDEVIIASDLGKALEKLGHTVLGIVCSGEESVREAGRVHPDVVLMDIRLRGRMDGLRAGRTIRSRFGIPIIYLTAFSDPATMGRAWTTKPLAFIQKPFDEHELESVLAGLNHNHPFA
jgi:CheY-like chemotaxis protein